MMYFNGVFSAPMIPIRPTIVGSMQPTARMVVFDTRSDSPTNVSSTKSVVLPTAARTAVPSSTSVPTQTLIPTFDVQFMLSISYYWGKNAKTSSGLLLPSVNHVGAACANNFALGQRILLADGRRIVCLDSLRNGCVGTLCKIVIYDDFRIGTDLQEAQLLSQSLQINLLATQQVIAPTRVIAPYGTK